MITHQRAAFTRMSLERLLNSCDSEMRVWVWHNGDHAETLNVVRSFELHPRFHKLYVSPVNLKLREPTNWFWANSDGEYLSKVDDDCLVSDNWAMKLRKAHDVEPKLGLVACWLFYEEDFVPELAARKIRTITGGHKIMVHGFVQGSGYVMKREVYRQLGPIRDEDSFTTYGIRATYHGWINGWYYPFIPHDHMDDARSPNYPFRTDEDFRANLSLSKANFGITSISEARALSRTLARQVQTEIIDPRDHFGWRKILNKLNSKIYRKRNLINRL
jgi:hypothetical protein